MADYMRDHPQLPLLTVEQCLAVFALAGISFYRLAVLTGISRQSIYLWRRGRAPLSHTLERVNTLAWKALVGLKDKRLPLPSRQSLARSLQIFEDISLVGATADLLPADLK